MAKPADVKNVFEPAVVKNLVGKIDNLFVDLDSERGRYMQKCRSIRETISAVYDEAKARGIPKKEMRAFVTSRQKLEKARQVLADLEAEQRETVELLAEAFGDAADLPLFASKLKRTQQAQADGSTARPH